MLLSVIIVIIMILGITKICFKLTTGRCKSPVCLIGKTVLITGGNSGIGYETALALAARGCRLIIADKDDCEKSKEKIIQETGNTNIVIKHVDLALLNSVRKLAKDINATENRLDVLINNAGIIYSGHGIYGRWFTQTNTSKSFWAIFIDAFACCSIEAYLKFLTVNNLNLPENETSSILSETKSYANSKLCNVISARGFAKKLKGTGVTANSLYPGVVRTPILKKLSDGIGKSKIQKKLILFLVRDCAGLFFKDAEEGAQTTLHLALSKELENVTGRYFMDCKPFITPSSAKNENFASRIWKASEDYVKLTPEEKLL